MKKIFLCFGLIICLFLSACGKETVLEANSFDTHENAIFTSRQQVAYYLAFQKMTEDNKDYFYDLKYLVFDYNNIDLPDEKYLEDMIQTFAKEHNLIYYQDKKDSMINRKIIDNGEYKQGVVLTYNELEHTKSKIVVELELWHSEQKNVRKIFTIEKDDEDWFITHYE